MHMQTAHKHTALITKLCQWIAQSDTEPSLNALAAQANMSAYHFQRVFKQITGISPKAYFNACRAGKLRENLAQNQCVTHALYDAGFQSPSRFYAQADALLGMKPAQYKAGGVQMTIHFALGQCSLGAILVASTERGICAIALGDDAETLLNQLQDRFPQAQLVGADADYEQLVAQVVGFVEAPQIGLDLPLDIRGTAFQQRVWQALRQIPAGKTVSYSQLAQTIGAPKSVRAVANACAANTIAVAIPCHRVVRTNHSLSGYRWGVERKRELLKREAE